MREKITDTIRDLEDALKLIEEIRREVKNDTFLTEGVRLFLSPQVEMVASNIRVAKQQLGYMSDFVTEAKRG